MTRRDTLINKIEKAGLVTVLIAILLRVFFGPDTNFALLVTSTLLSTYYLWFGFFIFNKITPQSLLNKSITQSLTAFQVYTGIIMGVVISYALIAILFGFFFYPVSPFVVASALVLQLSFNIFLVVYRIVKKKNHGFLGSFSFRATIFSILLILHTATPLETRLDILFKDYPEFIQVYLEFRDNPDDEKLQDRLREERSRFR